MRTSRDEEGVVAINLVLVLAFALYAVIMLTNTTVRAAQIDDRVKKIRGEVFAVDTELTNVPQLDQTAATAAEIDTATKNLERQATEIVGAAQSIDRTVSFILSNATSIDASVDTINPTLGSILGVVRSIDGGGAIGAGGVQRSGVAGINDRVLEVRRAVAGIKGDTGSVLAEVGPGHGGPGGLSIHGHTNSIDCTVVFSGRICGAHP
ncbi:MAG TPA: hypothetical protein VK988_01890 [Acidimicrobiales bacterium]|nr:hypothetical protein [Acidimicrobiales bacterium]